MNVMIMNDLAVDFPFSRSELPLHIASSSVALPIAIHQHVTSLWASTLTLTMLAFLISTWRETLKDGWLLASLKHEAWYEQYCLNFHFYSMSCSK